MPFLGHFRVVNQGPVLYIQEEDGLAILKDRTDKIWPGKQVDKVRHEGGVLIWEPGVDAGDLSDAPLDGYVKEGFTLSDPSWQSWLDEQLANGQYVMVVLDPLMMMAGDVEENRAQEMTTKIFRPLKQLADKHSVAICLVHHMRKLGQNTENVRGGQLMLGSVANHAWAEDSLYVKVTKGDLAIERESKHTTSGSFKIGHIRNKAWEPIIHDEQGDLDEHAEDAGSGQTVRTARRAASVQGGRAPGLKVSDALKSLGKGTHTTREIADRAGLTIDGARRQLLRAEHALSAGTGKWVYKP
jgi:hypothetical protein